MEIFQVVFSYEIQTKIIIILTNILKLILDRSIVDIK